MVSQSDIVMAVERLRQRLGATLPFERVVLFGSHGRGDARADSDADLIVVSPAFHGKSLGQRAYPLRRAWDLDVAVDFLCYTPEAFATLAQRTSIVQVALREGRDVLA